MISLSHFIIVLVAHLCTMKANLAINSVDFGVFIETDDYHQVTSFASSNFDGKMTALVNKNPTMRFSFEKSRQNLAYFHENKLNSIYTLQESLVTLDTGNLKEIKVFVDFLKTQSTVRKSPKCLILYSSNNFTSKDETCVIDALKYAWYMKFLDFTLVATDLTDSVIYHFNPFDDVVYRNVILENEVIETFPDKLKNAHGYPFYISELNEPFKVTFIEHPGRGLETRIHSELVVYITAEILNFNIIAKNAEYEYPILSDFLKKWNLDVHPEFFMHLSYQNKFLIPTEHTRRNVIAYVPIIFKSQAVGFFKMLFNVGVFSVFLLLFSRLRAAPGSIGVFDLVRIFFAQTIAKEPQSTVHRIIFLTIIVVSVKITNDILLDIILIQFENKEVPFETYEDLYSSQFQTYTNIPWLKSPDVTDDPYLMKILNRTMIGTTVSMGDCWSAMENWKNWSCILNPKEPEVVISAFLNPDGTPTIKVAKPPIFVEPPNFYWFADNSPYAMKFFEVTRRIKESDLLYWPASVRMFSTLQLAMRPKKIKLDDSININQILTPLCIGYFISVIAFTIEWIGFKISRTGGLKYLKKN